MFIFNTATTTSGVLADPADSLGWLSQVKSEAPDTEPFTKPSRCSSWVRRPTNGCSPPRTCLSAPKLGRVFQGTAQLCIREP